MEVLKLYKEVLMNRVEEIPTYYWNNEDGKENAKKCFRYLTAKKLRIPKKSFKEHINIELLEKYKLLDMLNTLFDGSMYLFFDFLYPDEFHIWDFEEFKGWDLEIGEKAMKWLIEKRLRFGAKMIREELTIKCFNENNLIEMLEKVFDNSIFKAINLIYPDKFKAWEFEEFKRHEDWNLSLGKDAVKWLVEDKLKLSDRKVREELNAEVFKENGLLEMLENLFDGKVYEAITFTYPNRFYAWELIDIDKSYWNDENTTKAMKWFIERRLRLKKHQIPKKLTRKKFFENNLDVLFEFRFDNSLFKAIDYLYPDEFREWQFNDLTLDNYWDKEKGIEATRWLLKEKLKFTDNEIKYKYTNKLLKENNLEKMVNEVFKGSAYDIINAIYPDKYKPWEMNIGRNYWDEKLGIEATKWLIEKKLKIKEDCDLKALNQKSFSINGLSSMLNIIFKGSVYKAIDSVYPGRFKPWEIHATRNYWKMESGIEATKWLVEEKLKLDLDEITNRISFKHFKDNGLTAMLISVFNGSVDLAIKSAYPNSVIKGGVKFYEC